MDSELKVIGGIILVPVILCASLIGYNVHRKYVNGNQKVFDTTWNYKYADVYLPNGNVKTIEIDTWNDYEGEQIQIHSKDGVNYIVSSFNTILRSR